MRLFRMRRHGVALLLGLSFTAMAAAPAFPAVSYAAVPHMDTIRVALFIDSGKSYRVVVPAVTLTSDQGLDIGNRLPGGVTNWFGTAPGVTVRASLDRFKVSLLETPDYAAADALAKALQATEDKPFVYKQTKSGKVVYRVYAGMYESLQAATDAKQRLAASGTVAPLLRGGAPAVAGPLHGASGAFATEAEAKPLLDTLLQSGLDAFLAVTEQAGKPVYAVWVGEAADDAQLAAVKQQAAQVGVALQTANTAQPYLLKREEVTSGLPGVTAARGADHYTMGGSGACQKTWVTGKDGAPVQVEERSKRKYRGSLELSEFSGSLAVVNEVPFETYVASVVGTEMNNGWPAEALKAQAVAARTFAIKQGLKYQIAHISDSTVDQAYYGVGSEGGAVNAAAQATAGEVMLSKGVPITPYFYSNGGGMTGDAVEVWGQAIEYVSVKPSPDEGAAASELLWFRVVLQDGTAGYIRSDYAKDTGMKSAAGLPILEATDSGVAIRPAPYVDNIKNEAIAKVNKGDRMTKIGQDVESNAFNWIRGPYNASQLLETINGTVSPAITGPLTSVEVAKTGPSARVTEMKLNGKSVTLAKSDNFRTALQGLPSTRFQVEETAKMSVMGADGQIRQVTQPQGTVYALSGSDTGGAKPLAANKGNWYMMNGSGQIRLATMDPQFRFSGYGFGHGLGMSQWGARGLAQSGYDYRYILQYYYNGVTISKD
ncbi:SpoIID/LytB domain-containing protein [Paenibacillus sp. HJGM_3]|uniref:SpoIID/LytB domain-containing protein n=1 Tax=Paenibacillus sp. HJGM_3 TaxID=3379816 RepID=UPI00386C1FCD